jgi:aryl-alcohol dehydrogenase-like predicted oxidoreductase
MALGTWGLSGDAYGAVPLQQAEAVIRRALDIGVSLFDTADVYGAGRMEALLGRVLGARDDVVVVTKIGTDRSTSPPTKRFDAEYLRAAAERSLKRLGRRAIDVLLLHNPSTATLESPDAIETLLLLVKEGKVKHWGVSAGDDLVARLALDKDAEVVELAYNLIHSIDLHRVAGDVLVTRAGILARSPLAHGMLSGTWTKEREFAEGDHRNERWTRMELERRLDQVEVLRFLVQGDITTLRGAAVRFVLANPIVSAVILGPRTVEQLEQLVRETGMGPRYVPDDQLMKLPRVLSKAGILT